MYQERSNDRRTTKPQLVRVLRTLVFAITLSLYGAAQADWGIGWYISSKLEGWRQNESSSSFYVQELTHERLYNMEFAADWYAYNHTLFGVGFSKVTMRGRDGGGASNGVETVSDLRFFDELTVTGTGPVTLSFKMPMSGSVANSHPQNNVNFLSSLLIQGTQSNGQGFADTILWREYNNSNGTFRGYESPSSFVATFNPGARIRLDGSTYARILTWGASGYWAELLYGNSAYSVVESLTPGGGFVSDSGYSYLAPVPEPAMFAAFALGSVALMRRCRTQPRRALVRVSGKRPKEPREQL